MKKIFYILFFFTIAILNFYVTVHADSSVEQSTSTTKTSTTRSSESNGKAIVSNKNPQATEKSNESTDPKKETFYTSTETDSTKNSIEQYEEIVGKFKTISITELKDVFTDTTSNIERIVYIGRQSCYYCREFAPSLNDFNKLIKNQLLYFDISDTSSPEYQYAFNVIGIPGTPATLRIKNGRVISAWIGSGKTGHGLYDEIFSKMANISAASVQYEQKTISDKEKTSPNISDTKNNSGNNNISDQSKLIESKNNQLTSPVDKKRARIHHFTKKHTVDMRNLSKTKNTRYESLPQTGASTSHISFWLGVSFIVFVLFILQGGNKSETAKYEY